MEADRYTYDQIIAVLMECEAGTYFHYDCQVPSPERLCLENALTAVENGAVIGTLHRYQELC